MYDEMQGEFSKENYPAREDRKLIADKYEPLPNEVAFQYSATYEYPYGDISVKLMYNAATKPDDEPELKDLPDEERDKGSSISYDPVPLSLNKLR